MKKKPQRTTTVWRLRVDMQTLDRIRKLAKKQDRTMANVGRLLLKEALNGKESIR